MQVNVINHFIIVFRDNPESDIYGANLYDRYLQKHLASRKVVKKAVAQNIGSQVVEEVDSESELDIDFDEVKRYRDTAMFAQSCQSILVCTGVYSSSRDYVSYGRARLSNHNHRDFVLDPQLTQPRFVTQNVLEAVKLVFEKEDVCFPQS